MGVIEPTKEVTLKDQMKKFVIKGLLGFQTVVAFNVGQKLGIFDYLATKAKASPGGQNVSSVSFTLEELVQNLHLDANYLDGWIHIGLVCGIFELDESRERTMKTAPFVLDILVDKTSDFYAGLPLKIYSMVSPINSIILDNFRSGQLMSMGDAPEEILREASENSAADGRRMEELFARRFRPFARPLRESGSILEVGCGFGVHLSHWAKKYKNCRIVGIDVDKRATVYSKSNFTQGIWGGRVTILDGTTADYVKTTPEPFDLVLLNEVLHELNPDEKYRQSVLTDIYSLLKPGGMLLIHDSIIPDTFAPNQEKIVFEVMHKWLEVAFGSRFYDQAGFRALVAATPFKDAELVKEGNIYFWALKK